MLIQPNKSGNRLSEETDAATSPWTADRGTRVRLRARMPYVTGTAVPKYSSHCGCTSGCCAM